VIATIQWSRGKVRVIDQTKLPLKLEYLNCQDVSSIRRAIREMKVRGAPVIGIVAAFGVVLGMRKSRARDFASFSRELDKVVKYLSGVRPTAINLFWALERMKRAVKDCRRSNNIRRLKKALLEEAIKILEEDKIICRQMADFGSRLIKDGDTILTHCNAGALATADYGTALGVIVSIFAVTFLGGIIKEVWVSGRWGDLISPKVFFALALFVFSASIPMVIRKIKRQRSEVEQ